MDSEDAMCITKIARGDQAALSELYTRYYQRLYRYLWHQLHGDTSLVEEALQDTFLAVWRAAGTFRGDARVATWLFRVAQRCARRIQRPRSQQSGANALSLNQIDESGDVLALPGDEERTLTRLALQDALSRLPDKQRDVVLLLFVHGFSSEEAAEILGVPSGTIRSRLRAARVVLLNDPSLQHIEEISS